MQNQSAARAEENQFPLFSPLHQAISWPSATDPLQSYICPHVILKIKYIIKDVY